MGRPKLNNPTEGVTIRLAIVAIAKLKAIAYRRGTKFNSVMREVLETYADQHDNQQ